MDSLQVPWSEPCGPAEAQYQAMGFAKTAGSVFALPPAKRIVYPADEQAEDGAVGDEAELMQARGQLVAETRTEGGEAHFPSRAMLEEAFQARHRRGSGRAQLSIGARALCKHFERKQARDTPHVFWQMPTGTEAQKNAIAHDHLQHMLAEATWRNLYRLHTDTLVYEIRNPDKYGMRWTVQLYTTTMSKNQTKEEAQNDGDDSPYYVLAFRGFLEPEHRFAPSNTPSPSSL